MNVNQIIQDVRGYSNVLFVIFKNVYFELNNFWYLGVGWVEVYMYMVEFFN